MTEFGNHNPTRILQGIAGERHARREEMEPTVIESATQPFHGRDGLPRRARLGPPFLPMGRP